MVLGVQAGSKRARALGCRGFLGTVGLVTLPSVCVFSSHFNNRDTCT